MLILAFETSCDDTSIALFKDNNLIFMYTLSQISIHNITGGVVPEVAAREHANAIFKVLQNVLSNSKITLQEIDYIGVTVSPGLIPSLLTGITVATTISQVLNIPLVEINHIQAHIFANYLEREEVEIKYPLVCLTVSGGHNEIYYMKNMFDFEKIGATTDDSAGEAFDKVSKMMGLGYPGGPIISKLSKEFEEKSLTKSKKIFPRSWLKKDEFDFSFSGLKSSVKREIDNRILKNGFLNEEDKKEISYEFENAVVDVLAYKLANAGEKLGVKTILLAGGVSANDRLKKTIYEYSISKNLEFIHPKKNIYCMDNSAMVGINTYFKVKYGKNN